MQPARFKLRAEERTCNPVQRPNLKGRGSKREPEEIITATLRRIRDNAPGG